MYRKRLYIIYVPGYGLLRAYFIWPGDLTCELISLN